MNLSPNFDWCYGNVRDCNHCCPWRDWHFAYHTKCPHPHRQFDVSEWFECVNADPIKGGFVFPGESAACSARLYKDISGREGSSNLIAARRSLKHALTTSALHARAACQIVGQRIKKNVSVEIQHPTSRRWVKREIHAQLFISRNEERTRLVFLGLLFVDEPVDSINCGKSHMSHAIYA